uniref:Reverse transcriptase/retrotransposon-derived protein RNase H-like domain-containing protein n=1 Tax=Lactuca sativa TaxID=4236 RepID=A0A9R1VX83_LACSA|nr:hypothetical protein LSAT_V11C400190310 [Lactuca sativa]
MTGVDRKFIKHNLNILSGSILIKQKKRGKWATGAMQSMRKSQSWYIAKSIEKARPLFQTLKGCVDKNKFKWTAEANRALKRLKESLQQLLTMAIPLRGETMQMYLCLRRYFQAHKVEVLTSFPVKQILLRPEKLG